MPSTKLQRVRRLLPHRTDRLKTRELEEMFELVEYMRLYFFDELETRKKEEKEKEDKGKKDKESFFTKKFTFANLLFANLVTGPALGLLLYVLIWTRFH